MWSLTVRRDGYLGGGGSLPALNRSAASLQHPGQDPACMLTCKVSLHHRGLPSNTQHGMRTACGLLVDFLQRPHGGLAPALVLLPVRMLGQVHVRRQGHEAR